MNATRAQMPVDPPAPLPLDYARPPRPVLRRSRLALTIALLVALWPLVLAVAAIGWMAVRAALR